MAPRVKRCLGQRECLSLDPKNPQKILGVATCACDLKQWEEETGGWGWAFWLDSLVQWSAPSGTRWRAMEQKGGYVHLQTCGHMHTHAYNPENS